MATYKNGSRNGAESFVLYTEYADSLRTLPPEQFKTVMLAVFDFVATGEMPEINDPVAAMAFSFMSSWIQRDKKKYLEVCEARAEAGRKGGKQKAANLANVANANFANKNEIVADMKGDDMKGSDMDGDEMIDDMKNKGSENKKKTRSRSGSQKKEASPKPPKKQYAEFVFMTEDEYAKLIDKYGEAHTLKMIEILDNYKGQNNKHYASDYRAILNWVVSRYQEELEHPKKQIVNPNHTDTYEDLERLYRGKGKAKDPNHVDTDEDWLKFFQEGYK